MRHDLLTLKLFVTVCEELNLARAAEREHIAPSALSRRISDLEANLGMTLFHRLRNGLEPTQAAQTLLRHARLVLRGIGEMEAELGDVQAGHRGQVRLWANSWGITQYLPEDLAAFLARHERVHVELHEDISPTIVRAVADNAADVGIVAAEVPAPGLHLIPYRSDRLAVALPAGHRLAGRLSLSVADLGSERVIRAHNTDSAIERLMRHGLGEAGETARARIGLSGFEPICRMAERGLGVGIVPSLAGERYARCMAIAMVPLAEPWAQRTLNICSTNPDALPGAARLLIEHLRRSAPDVTATAPRAGG